MPGNVVGDDRVRLTVYRPSASEWLIRNDDGSEIRILFGLPGDRPVPDAFPDDAPTAGPSAPVYRRIGQWGGSGPGEFALASDVTVLSCQEVNRGSGTRRKRCPGRSTGKHPSQKERVDCRRRARERFRPVYQTYGRREPMRKTLVGMLVLASLLTGSAESQELSPITAVTMAPDHIRGGQTALATVTLGSPAPIGGTVVTVFSLHLSVILVGDPTPSAVTVPAGASSVQFRVAALPLDTTVSTFMGASVGGQTVYGRLTVWRGPLWQSRIAVFRPGSAEWFLRNEEKRGNVGCL